ncbi:MAG: PEP-CTERM sorting domain-containing protein [Phycisphaerae bacterium]|nr:PEP-CTERM sorting domain-containing protein [Phycisphaerae bacterium]
MRFCHTHLSRIFGSLMVAAIVTTASATTINFDEFPAVNDNSGFLTEEYAGLGIHFVTTDDGSIFDGLTDGDPGNWGLEGTNWTQFLGFNGSSYALTTNFDAPVSGFQLDVSRSNGSSAGDTFSLAGYLGGSLVDSAIVTLGPINTWHTIGLTQTVDSVVWSGAGNGFHPFGVDNLQWVPEPSALVLLALAGMFGYRRR